MIAMMDYGDIKKLLLGADGDAQRLEIVMDLGKDLAPVPGDAQCTEIVGCASFVQICRRGNNFYGRADSALVRGIVAILLAMVDGRDATQIKNMDLYMLIWMIRVMVIYIVQEKIHSIGIRKLFVQMVKI